MDKFLNMLLLLAWAVALYVVYTVAFPDTTTSMEVVAQASNCV